MIEISISDEDFSRALRQLKSVPYGIQKAMYPAVAETMQHIRRGAYPVFGIKCSSAEK